MRPTDKQIKAVKDLQGIIGTWATTNDIRSPTLGSDIRELVEGGQTTLSEAIHESDQDVLRYALLDLLDLIQNIR